jgi:hypothetical protein
MNSGIALRAMFTVLFLHLILLIKSFVTKTDFKEIILTQPIEIQTFNHIKSIK